MVETKLHNERGEEPTHKSIPCYYVNQIFRSTNSSKSCLDYAQVETSRPTCMFRNLTHTEMVHFSVISQINLWITIKRILHCSKKLLLNETHRLCDIIHWQVISIILSRQSRTYKDWKLKLNSKKLCTLTQCYSHCSDHNIPLSQCYFLKRLQPALDSVYYGMDSSMRQWHQSHQVGKIPL